MGSVVEEGIVEILRLVRVDFFEWIWVVNR